MEMLTPCPHCGEQFDLDDGCGSRKWYPNEVICESCREKEDNEIFFEDKIDDLLEDINCTESYTVDMAINLLKEKSNTKNI